MLNLIKLDLLKFYFFIYKMKNSENELIGIVEFSDLD